MTLKILEQEADRIVVEVEVDYYRTPQQMLAALDLEQNTIPAIVAQIPRQHSGRKRVVFELFVLNQHTSDEAVARLLTARSLIPDVYAQCSVNEADKSFSDMHPNIVGWEDAGGEWCYCSCEGGGVYVVHLAESCGKGRWVGGIKQYLDD